MEPICSFAHRKSSLAFWLVVFYSSHLLLVNAHPSASSRQMYYLLGDDVDLLRLGRIFRVVPAGRHPHHQSFPVNENGFILVPKQTNRLRKRGQPPLGDDYATDLGLEPFYARFV
ncbi:hypothetical protein Ddc_09505 [Ditylenchus destructor]|nr:hypothetical protein Ddc_09505 [Ditylenchus destructor]